jgi:tricorn protease
MTFRHFALTGISTVAVMAGTAHASETGYYTDPALQGNEIVFASEGDLWAAGIEGGAAVRLTTHEEVERDPAISPDGDMLAFTAQYDGASEAYVMPVTGGTPKQLTHEGGGVSVIGWTPDGQILISSRKGPGSRVWLVRSVDPKTGETETLPLDGATSAVVNDDGLIVFSRYGLAMMRDNAKLYRGGLMAQLWTYEPGADAATRLAEDFGAPLRDPMLYEDRIVFVSDKSGHDNLWSVAMDGSDPVQHTDLSDWQIRQPHMDEGRVAFQQGADLAIYDIASDTLETLDIALVTDRDMTRTRFIDEPLDYMSAAMMAGNGESASVTARGRVVVAYLGQRRRVELPIPHEARARNAVPSPDGETIYLIQDEGARGEIWAYPADGRGDSEVLTSDSDFHIWTLYPSPDGETLIYHDKNGTLNRLTLESGKTELLETTESDDDNAFRDLTFSSGGRYLTYTGSDARGLSQVVLRDLETGERMVVAGGKYPAYGPTFSPDGAWLYFVSDRNFNASPGSPWGDRVPGPAFDKRGKILALQLDPEAAFPFETETELDFEEDDADADEDSSESDEDEDDAEYDIDFDTLNEDRLARTWPVPVGAGNYWQMAATDSHLYVRDDRDLKTIRISDTDPKVETFMSNISGYRLSNDGKTVFVVTRDNRLVLAPAGAKAPDDLGDMTLRLGDWRPGLDMRAEWRQMVMDAWRLHRDFAYDPTLRGVDWEAVRDRYLPLVDRAGHRQEVNDLLAQMSAELGILHSQIRAGDQPRDDENGVSAQLGADYTPVKQGLKITRILDGERELHNAMGPLRKPGLDVREGDIITTVDGRKVATEADLHDALLHKSGQEVRLDLQRPGRFRRMSEMSAIVKPVGSWQDRRLRYGDWVQSNRERVADMGKGEIGYLHLRAMGGGDVASFTRDFGEHLDKDGLIIDVRGNNGGNVDSFIINALLKKAWAYWDQPGRGAAQTNMQGAFRGHVAVLIDEGTYSDGETFAAGVRALELGPLIGTQTAGAGIWLSGRNRLADGGMARIAEYAQYGIDGSWLIEGAGVAPDIEVENPPVAAFEGEDAQIAAAIDWLEDKIADEPIAPLKPKPLPKLGGYGESGK